MNLEISFNLLILIAIVTLPPTVAALAALVQAAKTHKAVNSRMTELLELTRQASGDAATLAEKNAESTRRDVAARIEKDSAG